MNRLSVVLSAFAPCDKTHQTQPCEQHSVSFGFRDRAHRWRLRYREGIGIPHAWVERVQVETCIRRAPDPQGSGEVEITRPAGIEGGGLIHGRGIERETVER